MLVMPGRRVPHRSTLIIVEQGTHRIPTDPRGFPTAHPAHSESLSIGAIRRLSPDQISSGMPYNCYDVAFWRTLSLV